MAGGAIRSWEFANILAKNHQVVLISPEKSEIQSQYFEMIALNDPQFKKSFKDAHILITQRLTFFHAYLAKLNGVKIIIDAYVPGPLEVLEHFKADPMTECQKKVCGEITNIIFNFKMADGIICASEKQRMLWLGFLLAQKLIKSSEYNQDASLRNFLTIVPFGLSSVNPQKRGKGLKEKLGLKDGDKVILWGGGIWNWFDPLSLIKAMKIVNNSQCDVKLVFMGVKPPDPTLPMTSMALQSKQLARELNLINDCVFFNEEWVPYNERENFLLDADIGASIHFDHLETEFSFRTRILDYLWAELPILTTKGDSFADLVEKHRLGIVVSYNDVEAIAGAILQLVNDPNQLWEYKENIVKVKKQFYWTSVTSPLQGMIDRLQAQTLERSYWKDCNIMVKLFLIKVKEKGLIGSAKAILKRFFPQHFS